MCWYFSYFTSFGIIRSFFLVFFIFFIAIRRPKTYLFLLFEKNRKRNKSIRFSFLFYCLFVCIPLKAGRRIRTSNGFDVCSLVSCKRANGLFGLLKLIDALLKSDDVD